MKKALTGDTRKIFKDRVDESNSARVLVGCKPIKKAPRSLKTVDEFHFCVLVGYKPTTQ